MSKFRMVPVERTPEMVEAGCEAFRTALRAGAGVGIADERQWAAEVAAAPSPWRPMSECPDDGTLIYVFGGEYEMPVLTAARHPSRLRVQGATSWMLASDFPLPAVENPNA